MADLTAADFAHLIAERISAEHVSISARWLEELRKLLSVGANEVFPTDRLLDHIPALIRELGGYVRAPGEESVAANTAVIAKAQELGALRHTQQASVHQLLAEYRLLGRILTAFVQEEIERLGLSPAAGETVQVLRRLNEAIWALMQTTVDTFVSAYTATIADHAERLEGFNRMVSHELRQPLGTLMYAVPLLKVGAVRQDALKQDHLLEVMERNVLKLTQLMEQLETLSRLHTGQAESPDVQRTEVASVARAVAQQLQEMAAAREVEIRIVEPLPIVIVDMARLELILMNLVSNAVKYSDPAKPQRSVVIEEIPSEDPRFIRLAVRDNGLGIPAASLPLVFRRFARAHADRDIELGIRGSGLGLAIALECAEAVGGGISVESTPGVGSTFLVDVPCDLDISPAP